MKTLFITTTRENMSAEEITAHPLSGALFSLRVTVPGVQNVKFNEN